jgi:hypothetical protein
MSHYENVSMAMDTHATTEELLEVVFSIQFVQGYKARILD